MSHFWSKYNSSYGTCWVSILVKPYLDVSNLFISDFSLYKLEYVSFVDSIVSFVSDLLFVRPVVSNITDSRCNYEFYDSQNFHKLNEKQVSLDYIDDI